jgi:hypothetical protein
MLALAVDQLSGPAAGLQLLGRPLVAHALEALRVVPGLDVAVLGEGAPHGTAVATLPPDRPWRPRAVGGLVLHDALCPLLPGAVLRDCIAQVTADSAVVGLRPVTDTIKQVDDGMVVGTENRNDLAVLASPVVIGPALLDPLAEAFPLAGDLAELSAVVERVAGLGEVRRVEVPSVARRLSDRDDVALLECLHELRRHLRER